MAFVIISFQGKELDRRVLERPMTVGRAPDCDLVLDDRKLSRHHCRIEPEKDSWAVVDLNSRNGTFIVRDRVRRQVLRSGDAISIADVRIVFHSGPLVLGRPSDPAAAAQRSGSEHPTLVVPPSGRPLPVPRPKPADEPEAPLDDTVKTPLPFKRPPARPIVNPRSAEEE